MRIPVATYRVQFNSDFRFADALAIVPHLHRLGITHLYASPIFAARANSTHGYDVVDPNRINPALGTEQEFEQLIASLQAREMGLILDIVPNHMAADPANDWWMDVLENGGSSPYAAHFGINWRTGPESVSEKILLPVLGAPYGTVLNAGEIQLSYRESGFYLNYWERYLPVAPVTYLDILAPGSEPLLEIPDFQLLVDILGRLPPRWVTEWEALEVRFQEKENAKRRLWKLYETEESVRAHVDRAIARINGNAGDPSSFDELHRLLDNQAYRLAYWRVATERINYRRFFDVSDLIGIRVEDSGVFNDSHRLVLEMVERGAVDGLRVDHIDGLADPGQYLERLPHDRVYLIVEKILGADEHLCRKWPVHGTTGYDFLGYMNSLFVDERGLDRLSWFYSEKIGVKPSLEDIEYGRKLRIMDTLFSGEMADLGSELEILASDDRNARDLSPRDLTAAIREVTACMSVYRTYTNSLTVSDRDRAYISEAFTEARMRCPSLDTLIYDFVYRVLTLRIPADVPDDRRENWLRFIRRWQQITGPIMAKAVEDSTFYVYNRLISLNEVGGILRAVGVDEFHDFLRRRHERWPAAMNASSTHDAKRSEDVRARINVLSEIVDEWTRVVTRWRRWMRGKRGSVDDNEEYFIYQTLVGAWPLFEEEAPEFRRRMQEYIVKAAREAREYTSWLQQSEEHEAALKAFIDVLFEDSQFQESFHRFVQRVMFYGAMNSLSQVILKLTAPGVPDFYRGTIQWDFSLVDPDNRRPFPFAPLTDFEERARSFLDHWRDGKIKIYLAEKTLAYRRANAQLFELGSYIPIETRGRRSKNVVTFARTHDGSWAITAAPRLLTQLSVALRPPTGIRAWYDTELVLPAGAPDRWRNVLTGETLLAREGRLRLASVLAHFSVALLSAR